MADRDFTRLSSDLGQASDAIARMARRAGALERSCAELRLSSDALCDELSLFCTLHKIQISAAVDAAVRRCRDLSYENRPKPTKEGSEVE